MSELADEQSAYRAAMARAEAASGIVRDEDGTELNGIEAIMRGETPELLPELDGAVPVVASDQTLTEEPVVETDTSEEQQQEATAVEEPLTVEQLQERLAQAEARLAEKDSFIGRQSGEVGELRSTVDAYAQRLAALEASMAQPVVAPTQVQITQDMINENPAYAAQLAYDQKNPQALEVAYREWEMVDEAGAKVWAAERRAEQREEALRAEIAATRSELQELRAPIAQSTEQQQWAQAFAQAEQGRPDFRENAQRLLEDVAPNFPHLVTALSQGDATAKAEALTALYAIDKLANPAEVAATLQQQANEAAAEAEAARAAAGVVAGQTTAGQGGTVPLTEQQQEVAAYETRMKAKPSLARGFTRG